MIPDEKTLKRAELAMRGVVYGLAAVAAFTILNLGRVPFLILFGWDPMARLYELIGGLFS